MNRAPEVPSTEELSDRHPLPIDASKKIVRERVLQSAHLKGGGFVVLAGGCSGTAQDLDLLQTEGDQLQKLSQRYQHVSVNQRLCLYKPRSKDEDWHGEETTNPVGAHALITLLAQQYGHMAMEIAYDYHLDRYADKLTFAWTGSRSIGQPDQIIYLATRDPLLPIGIKNGLDGEVEEALQLVDLINKRRSDTVDNPALAVLLYRGGYNALTPKSWESRRHKAHELSQGRIIDDSAHGSSIAHDPNNTKSNYGQQATLEHIMSLTQEGYAGVGVMVETSDINSRTDPNLPHAIGLTAIRELLAVHQKHVDLSDKQAIMSTNE